MANYMITHLEDVDPIKCPCGTTKRAFVSPDNQTATLHLLEVEEDTRLHYHKTLTEIYLILEGEGHMELDGEIVPVKPLTGIMIKPGCRHRAIGEMRIAIIPIPAFDPEDEWFDD